MTNLAVGYVSTSKKSADLRCPTGRHSFGSVVKIYNAIHVDDEFTGHDRLIAHGDGTLLHGNGTIVRSVGLLPVTRSLLCCTSTL